ncbi:SURF1 family protein [Cellulomonas chengniuliangii]|uniref:SURF1 family protein n=1 Tax=Cellulomonas chengniuliangii TaxID=2968084 RepID=UPI001D0E30F9|nr:SURF1 family protein [Cellulomonas chengniuliangii]MCC2318992.1 SURF1 family protein [Cellulomonas chengniuliangii]
MPASPPPATPLAGPAPSPSAPTGRVEPTTFLRAAVRPRMLALLAVLLVAAALCARLGVWQLDRAEVRGGATEAEEQAAREAETPRDIGDVLPPQTTFTGSLVGQRVVARGTYEPEGQLLVADRAIAEQSGYLVLTPLRVSDTLPSAAGGGVGDAAPVLPVVRGWVADPADAAALAVPEGEVTVTGFLQSSEGPGMYDRPAGQVDAISSAELLGHWRGPIWTGYVVMVEAEPADAALSAGLELMPPPTRVGSGLNIQNLAYAAQWWIFGGFALFVWVRLVRDEAAGDGPVPEGGDDHGDDGHGDNDGGDGDEPAAADGPALSRRVDVSASP